MSTEPRVVVFTTAIRSEYDILYSVIRAVEDHSDLTPQLVVSGAHLTELYGKTEDLIALDGFPVIARIENLLNADTAAARVKSAAVQLTSLVDVFAQARPDIVIAMADREDALTVAVAGAYMGIPVAHIGAGENANDGNVDNAVRHAVTKLAHLHFATTQKSAERVTQMGEEPWRIHVVGAPGLDRLLSVEKMPREELLKHLPVEGDRPPQALVIQHPISTEIEQAGDQMRTTLESLVGLEMETLVSYPNSDAGSQRMIRVIEEYAARYPFLHAYRNLPRPIFVNLLRTIEVLVGNSSCGIIEAPLLHLPVVNVGTRQRDREHAENVIFVPHEVERIQEGIKRALYDESFKAKVQDCTNPYGDGHAGERIAQILAEVAVDDRLLGKRSTY